MAGYSVNEDLLRDTVNKIRSREFNWHQGEWVYSGTVTGGFPEDLYQKHVCGTSFCFAGYVATRTREVLYYEEVDTLGYYRVSQLVVANGEEPGSRTTRTGFYRATKSEGKVWFTPFEGRVITMRKAAINDLRISPPDAMDLFVGSNSFEDLSDIVDEIIERNNEK